jgi:exonuclease SbcC
MALALSDWVRAQSRLQRALFFIDEGFGSLDRDNLSLVVQTLRTLARSGRPIGIITHREELKEELDAFVLVSLSERGSVLRPSWLYAAEGLPPGADAH